MPSFVEPTNEYNDAELQAVLDAPSRKGSTGKPKVDPAERTLNVWFKLPHKFMQTIEGEGLQDLSLAKCSNPQCPNPGKPKGAVANVKGSDNISRDMCRHCFIAGYGT